MTNSPDQLKACREAFEKHLTSNGVAFDRPVDASGIVTIYSDYYTNQAWETWQAAWNTRPTAVASHAEGEVVAYCEPDNPFNSTAFAWPGSERDPSRHTQPLYANPPRSDDEAERTVKENLTVGDEARDAARYRWLRELPRNYDGRKNGFHVTLAKAKDAPREWVIESMRGLDLDQAIDAAMAARGEDK